MFKDLVDFLHQAIISLKPSKEAVYSDIFGRPVEHADEFFHPVKFRGIPVFDPDSILSHVNYQKQIDRLREVVDIGDHRKAPSGKPLFDELFLEVLRRFIAYVHMVPASEDHHHKYTGGLLTHSIEASIEALRWSKELKCQITHMADQDAQIKPILDYAAWLGCLLHDIGKIMRDVSVDAVEVIHPLTKRPIPLTNPIVSWYPQKESLTAWAKNNHISAYSVTWIRNRTHNRHNIDSAQILAPLLQGTFAMDYLLSSPIKQELYSELVRCLSGYTQHKGHLSDCIRMGDSVSTNRALQIQYDAVRGHRRVSTATKLYQCINHARKDWEWNRPKSHGWVIGNEAYIRWSAAFDSIVNASMDLQYGLPTDTRNILTIMEQNGFAHLFDPDSSNDRILKFTPGNFNNDQKNAILSGKQSVTWIDLVKMVTPHVIFGEQPMPPSMAGIIFLPSAKLFFSVNKDGDISPMQAPQQIEAIEEASTEQKALTQQEPQQIEDKKPAASKKTDTSKKSATKPAKEKSITEGFKPSLPKPAQQTNSLNHALFDESDDTPATSIMDMPTKEQAVEKIQERIEPTITLEPNITNGKLEAVTQPETTNQTTDTPFIPAKQEATAAETKHQDTQIAATEPKETNAPFLDEQKEVVIAETSAPQNEKMSATPNEPSLLDKPLITMPKNVRASDTFKSLIDAKVRFFKTKRDVYFDANDAQEKLQRPIMEILKDLKAANELHTDPMKPAILTTFHKVGTENIKCIALQPQLTRLFVELSEGTYNDTQAESLKDESGKQQDISVKEVSTPEAKSSDKSVKENSETAKPTKAKAQPAETPSIPAQSQAVISLKTETLKPFINKDYCHRHNGSLFLDIELLAGALNLSVDDVFIQLTVIEAFHVCPLEPTPRILTIKKPKGTKRYVKLAQPFDALMPARKPVPSKEAEIETPPTEPAAEEKAVDCIDVSLRNFANAAGVKSLVYYLVSKNAPNLIDYRQDGNIAINLAVLNYASYKPFNKLKIGDSLIEHGATKKDGVYIISHANIEKIDIDETQF